MAQKITGLNFTWSKVWESDYGTENHRFLNSTWSKVWKSDYGTENPPGPKSGKVTVAQKISGF